MIWLVSQGFIHIPVGNRPLWRLREFGTRRNGTFHGGQAPASSLQSSGIGSIPSRIRSQENPFRDFGRNQAADSSGA